MLVYKAVVPDTAVEVDKSRAKRGQESSFAVVADLFQVDEMRADHSRVDGVVVAQLYFDSLTEGRKHFREHDLLVPYRRVTVLLNTGLPLNHVTDESGLLLSSLFRSMQKASHLL